MEQSSSNLPSYSPFNSQETEYLRDLSLSLQIYCEWTRLIFFVSLSPFEFGSSCQFCGCHEMKSNHSLQLLCSSCGLATDRCMYTHLPINVVSDQVPLTLKCHLCQSFSTLRRPTVDWIQSKKSYMMCLFCSLPLVTH